MSRRTARHAFDRLRTPRRFTRFLKTASVCVLVAGLLSPFSQAAAAQSAAGAASNDYCGGHCSGILPPGENGNAALPQILLNQAFGTQPSHADDQLGPYAGLARGYSGLTDAKINNFFNDASFGVPSDQVASSEKPAGRSDVAIVRDKKTGVPHITGTTRYGTEFGAGYAAAEDRLRLVDVFRHVGRGQLTSRPARPGRHQARQDQLAEPAHLPAGGGVHLAPVTGARRIPLRRRVSGCGPPPAPPGRAPGARCRCAPRSAAPRS